jgi:hypothetical protein
VSFEHVPNLVCVQQSCAKCEGVADTCVDCVRCGKRVQSFWLDPVGNLLSHVFASRPWADRVVAIAHNARAFDLQFILNRLVKMKLLPRLLVTNGQKIVSKDGESHVVRQPKLSAYALAQVARGLRAEVREIVVSAPLQQG